MSPRIQLDDSVSRAPVVAKGDGAVPPPLLRPLFDADWEGPTTQALMLYVSEEPRVGLEFSYHGLDWQIVDYREGWIAKLLVD